MPKAIRRLDASKGPADFYVKGSYVLDVVFGTSHANDIDVFYGRFDERPSIERVTKWIESHGLPEAKSVDQTTVDDLESCSGGGTPRFNFERWHLKSDGKLYTLQDTTEASGDIFGYPFKTTPVPLDIGQARQERLSVLLPVDEISLDEDGEKYLTKTLRKLVVHKTLFDLEVVDRLKARLQEIYRLKQP